MLKKLICNSIPIEFKLFSQKFLKLKEFSEKDSLDNIFKQISENQEMYY
jgi:hypothetical protein